MHGTEILVGGVDRRRVDLKHGVFVAFQGAGDIRRVTSAYPADRRRPLRLEGDAPKVPNESVLDRVEVILVGHDNPLDFLSRLADDFGNRQEKAVTVNIDRDGAPDIGLDDRYEIIRNPRPVKDEQPKQRATLVQS
jgi:hypothetical protein